VLSKLREPGCTSIEQPPITASAGRVRSLVQVAKSLRTFHQTRGKIRPIEIKRIVRPMRGGSQSRLIEGEDGLFYVAKFTGNPQGTRTLANEWITQSIMSHLGVSTPPLSILRLPKNLRNEALAFDVGDKKKPVEGEWHLGSLCPVNPETKVIFDFLPRRLLKNVSNLNDFAKALVVDRWLYQLDQRQAVFVHERGLAAGEISFRAHFIDHGMAFAGSAWELREATGNGLYMDRVVYSLINMPEICEETVAQIEALTEEQTFSALATLPDCWLSYGDREELRRLVENLYKNRSRLRRTVTNQIASLALNAVAKMEKKGIGCAGRPAISARVAYGT
jgi:hypothetical protein